ncbi:uncharacterized protein LOC119683927 [Teleopsis dalmanni]|uniref:uncharacterized protein LOC119683886 n=1 Tax=Teleopsis dalmanni TaxID=139649 RepID=UPI0018CD5FC4|nr:uncharacterized protein LOC119683886 [Teleopsis dalmanni]XP_037953743.1 uncharacterized protein LOC119683927 [Teleopsis dalmanni]
MGCSHSNTKSTFNETPFGTNNGEAISPDKKEDSTNFEEQRQYPSSEAFIVSLDTGSQPEDYHAADSTAAELVNAKKIPKRLQQLMQQPSSSESKTTREDLEEKLAKAEQRRLEYQQHKIFAVQRITQFKDISIQEKVD